MSIREQVDKWVNYFTGSRETSIRLPKHCVIALDVIRANASTGLDRDTIMANEPTTQVRFEAAILFLKKINIAFDSSLKLTLEDIITIAEAPDMFDRRSQVLRESGQEAVAVFNQKMMFGFSATLGALEKIAKKQDSTPVATLTAEEADRIRDVFKRHENDGLKSVLFQHNAHDSASLNLPGIEKSITPLMEIAAMNHGTEMVLNLSSLIALAQAPAALRDSSSRYIDEAKTLGDNGDKKSATAFEATGKALEDLQGVISRVLESVVARGAAPRGVSVNSAKIKLGEAFEYNRDLLKQEIEKHKEIQGDGNNTSGDIVTLLEAVQRMVGGENVNPNILANAPELFYRVADAYRSHPDDENLKERASAYSDIAVALEGLQTAMKAERGRGGRGKG